MTKEELSQLYWLNREVINIKKSLSDLEENKGLLASMSKDDILKYSAEINELKESFEKGIKRCFFEIDKINDFINGIKDSQMRLIISLKFVDGLTWQQVAMRIGEYDESYVRRKFNRFIEGK